MDNRLAHATPCQIMRFFFDLPLSCVEHLCLSEVCPCVPMHVCCRYNGTDTNFTSVTAMVKWQKRFFIFSEAQRVLYYFKSTEEVGKGVPPRGMVRMGPCRAWGWLGQCHQWQGGLGFSGF